MILFKEVTLKDIAAHLRLSVPTVSRALGGYSDIALKTRELVASTARAMNYRPNLYAKNLVATTNYARSLIDTSRSFPGISYLRAPKDLIWAAGVGDGQNWLPRE